MCLFTIIIIIYYLLFYSAKIKHGSFRDNNLLMKYYVKQIVNWLLCLNKYGYSCLYVKPENMILCDNFIIKLYYYGQIKISIVNLQELN